MSAKFCPDCGEQCGPDDEQCPECGFPMRFQVVSHGSFVTIPKSQAEHWQRIAQILRKNGMKLESKQAGAWSGHQAWWALPIVGAFIFLMTLIFGGSLVDTFWKPVYATVPVLDLNQPVDEEGNPLPQAQRSVNTAATANGDDSEVDTSFLKQALKTSEDQLVEPETQLYDPGDFVDLPEASADQIRRLGERATVEVSVSEQVWKGTLMSGDSFAVASDVLLDAFRNETRSVVANGSLTQETVYVEPMANLFGLDKRPARVLIEGQAVGVTLLQGRWQHAIDFGFNFDEDITVGSELWICNRVGSKLYPEKVQVIDTLDTPDEVTFWVVDSGYGSNQAGAPVFDLFGRVTGIFLEVQGSDCVLSLYWLKDKAPQIYRELQ